MEFENADYENLERCPWCTSARGQPWGRAVRGFESVLCRTCGLIYVKRRLNTSGLRKFYEEYLSHVHQADPKKNEYRRIMYELEFEFIDRYAQRTNVLDVGCSGGYFLDLFHAQGYECFGVEVGEEAAAEAARKHCLWKGDFADLDFNRNFDLIIFRGVIEHLAYPKTYFEKATSLLNDSGLVLITSTPNSRAFCCVLFEEKWNQHAPEAHLMHFSAHHFDEWFAANGFQKVDEHFFYEETPYAMPESDILKVAQAIQLKKEGREIDFTSPAFYGNMLTLVYKKVKRC